MIPVGPLDKEQLTGAVNALQRQGPDADRQLAAGHAGRPRLLRGPPQRDPGLRRRRQLRAAGPVRGGAGGGQAGPRPDDLGRRPAGQRARAPAAPVHRARRRRARTPTCRTRASSATSWRRCWRAPTAPTSRRGPRSRARPTEGGGPSLSAGLFQDTITVGEQRWYTLEVPKGRRVLASVTAIPPYESGGGSTLRTELLDPDGGEVRVRAGPAQRRAVGDRARPGRDAERPHRRGRSTAAATCSASRSTAAISTTSRSRSSSASSSWPRARRSGSTREAGELATPTPTPTRRPPKRRRRRRSTTIRARPAGSWSPASRSRAC